MANITQYSGPAFETYDKIQHGRDVIIINQVYESLTANCLFYINSKGYMHILKPAAVKLNHKLTGYCMIDYLLTKNNKLEEKTRTKSLETIEALKDYISELITE